MPSNRGAGPNHPFAPLMADFVTSLVVIDGPDATLEAFTRRHLAGNTFDFNTVRPMPPGLDIESSSSVETGYAALYGDWQTVAGYWMFKEPAQQFGFPFPLESREQVIRSLQSFDCAELYLAPAEAYHNNIIQHGHGDWHGWCRENWGAKWNADEVVIEAKDPPLYLKFVTAGSYPKPILKALSTTYPDLQFHVRYADEHLRWARDFVLVNGKETRKIKRPAKEISAEIRAFGGTA